MNKQVVECYFSDPWFLGWCRKLATHVSVWALRMGGGGGGSVARKFESAGWTSSSFNIGLRISQSAQSSPPHGAVLLLGFGLKSVRLRDRRAPVVGTVSFRLSKPGISLTLVHVPPSSAARRQELEGAADPSLSINAAHVYLGRCCTWG